MLEMTKPKTKTKTTTVMMMMMEIAELVRAHWQTGNVVVREQGAIKQEKILNTIF